MLDLYLGCFDYNELKYGMRDQSRSQFYTPVVSTNEILSSTQALPKRLQPSAQGGIVHMVADACMAYQ